MHSLRELELAVRSLDNRVHTPAGCGPHSENSILRGEVVLCFQAHSGDRSFNLYRRTATITFRTGLLFPTSENGKKGWTRPRVIPTRFQRHRGASVIIGTIPIPRDIGTTLTATKRSKRCSGSAKKRLVEEGPPVGTFRFLRETLQRAQCIIKT